MEIDDEMADWLLQREIDQLKSDHPELTNDNITKILKLTIEMTEQSQWAGPKLHI